MQIKKILITGDDGYNSVGIRTLIRLFKGKYSVSVAATLNQQSAVGGKMNLTNGIAWGEEKIDGIKVLWVDGSPVDAMEVAQGYYNQRFDVVLSGINFGENVSYSIVSSGTFSAAVRALGLQLAPKAIVLSCQASEDKLFIKHNTSDDLTDFLEYPGKQAVKVIQTIFDNDFFGKELVNVNFPLPPSQKHKVVKVAKDLTKLWNYPLILDRKKKLAFQKADDQYSRRLETDISTDVGALHKGYITLTPLNYLET